MYRLLPPTSSGSITARLAALGTVFAMAGAAQAAEPTILSAGAIEPGLKAAAAAFEKQTGHTARITFNAAPELHKKMAANPAFDVVIAPPAVIVEFAAASQLAEERASVGRVGMGVAVTAGAPVPGIATPESFRQSLLDADSLVFNHASTGLYLENLLKKMDRGGGRHGLTAVLTAMSTQKARA